MAMLCFAGLIYLHKQNPPREFELYLQDVKTHQRDTLTLPWMYLDSVNDKDDVLLHNRLPVPCMCMKDTGEYQLMRIVDMREVN